MKLIECFKYIRGGNKSLVDCWSRTIKRLFTSEFNIHFWKLHIPTLFRLTKAWFSILVSTIRLIIKWTIYKMFDIKWEDESDENLTTEEQVDKYKQNQVVEKTNKLISILDILIEKTKEA